MGHSQHTSGGNYNQPKPAWLWLENSRMAINLRSTVSMSSSPSWDHQQVFICWSLSHDFEKSTLVAVFGYNNAGILTYIWYHLIVYIYIYMHSCTRHSSQLTSFCSRAFTEHGMLGQTNLAVTPTKWDLGISTGFHQTLSWHRSCWCNGYGAYWFNYGNYMVTILGLTIFMASTCFNPSTVLKYSMYDENDNFQSTNCVAISTFRQSGAVTFSDFESCWVEGQAELRLDVCWGWEVLKVGWTWLKLVEIGQLWLLSFVVW